MEPRKLRTKTDAGGEDSLSRSADDLKREREEVMKMFFKCNEITRICDLKDL